MTLKNLRKNKKLTAEQLAKKLGISRAHYTHLENGSRQLTDELIGKLADKLNVSPKVIINESSKQNNMTPSSWIFKVRIQGKPLLKAFNDDLKRTGNLYLLSQEELTEMLIKFIFFHIEHSLRQELKENTEVVQFISRKLGHNQTQP